MRGFIHILAGGLFGTGLALSGMTNPSKVIAFLDLTGNWNSALAFFMGGALSVSGLGNWLLRRRGETKPLGKRLPETSSDPISYSMLAGSAIFGIGWGVGGICPGPALANISILQPEIFIFIPTMLVGMILAQRLFGLDR